MAGTGIAIIGTGYSGLSAAYELVRHGQRPVVFESGRVAGGLAECFRFAGTHLEKYYHHWFNHDEDMLRLVRELGLAKHLVRRQTTTSTYYDGKIYRLSSPTDLMRFRPLSMTDRLRLGRMVMRGRRIRDYHVLEGITARRWITETAGQTVYDVVWRPLLEGKFGRHADEISAVWFWSKLRTRGRSRSRRLAEELLYIDGGMQRVTTAMVDVVRTGGGQIRLGCPVKTVRRVDGEWEILTATGAERFAKVLVTAPTPIAMSLLEEMPDAVRRRSESIPYLGVTELMLILKRRLSEAYWLNVNDLSYPYVGVIEHTNFQEPSAYGGYHVVYLTTYRDEAHETVGMGHRALFEHWRSDLERMFPGFEESWVTLAASWQNAHAQPVVRAGCENQILPCGTPLPGVWMCSMAQIYPEDRGTNYAVRLGRQTAHEMLASATQPDRVPRVSRIVWPVQATETKEAAPEPVAALESLSPA